MSLRTLIVDDEFLARARLRTLLGDCTAPAADVVGEASQATQAQQQLDEMPVDLLLLDIHMPGLGGVELAHWLRGRADAPAIVFVTAHAEHAVEAFELEAVDYLTKPVRAERLQQALQKAERFLKERRVQPDDPNEEVLYIQERGRAERVPLSEVVYIKSEFKYLTIRTPAHSYIYDGSLNDMEERYPDRFVRVHRNALVARSAMRALEKYDDGEDVDGWALRLRGIADPVIVSRRQLSAVREALKDSR